MSSGRRNWTREELILAFNLYCKLPFSKISYRLSEVKELAKVINRTPSAVAWKLVNFASFDPTLKERSIAGAKNAGKLDKEIFFEFYNDWNSLVTESEILRDKYFNNINEVENEIDVSKIISKKGDTREAVVQQRVNQSFFRQIILASYENKCCITGLPVTDLLVASHIIPWSKDEKNRLNPENGLCLNSLHDKAFDLGFLTLDENFKIRISVALKNKIDGEYAKRNFLNFEGKQIEFPKRFLPNQKFLEYHRNNIFRG